jgi:hypothetical protein
MTLFHKLPLLLTLFVDIIHSYGSRRFRDEQESKYGYFDEAERLRMLQATREMFYFGYDNYMKYAFPMDELDPIHCTGRGPDYDNPLVTHCSLEISCLIMSAIRIACVPFVELTAHAYSHILGKPLVKKNSERETSELLPK